MFFRFPFVHVIQKNYHKLECIEETSTTHINQHSFLFPQAASDLDHLFRVRNIIDVGDEPLHRCRQVLILRLYCAHRVNCPVSFQLTQAQLFLQVLHAHCCNVSLVGQHQQYRVLHQLVAHQTIQFLCSQLNPFLIRTVDNEYQPSAFIKIVSPQAAQFLLAAYIPDLELDSLVVELFDIESNGGDGLYGLPHFERVESSSFACSVKSKHEYLAREGGHLLLEYFLQETPHVQLITLKDLKASNNIFDDIVDIQKPPALEVFTCGVSCGECCDGYKNQQMRFDGCIWRVRSV